MQLQNITSLSHWLPQLLYCICSNDERHAVCAFSFPFCETHNRDRGQNAPGVVRY